MDQLNFSSFGDIQSHSKGKELVLFGTGNIASKTLCKLHKKPSFIVDNNSQIWGERQYELDILDPASLQEMQTRCLVIVCSTSFREIVAQLKSMGFSDAAVFVSPVLNDLRALDDLENHSGSLLLAAGLAPEEGPGGGGLYHVQFSAEKTTVEKVYSGKCHSIVKKDDVYLVVDCNFGLVRFDKQFRLLEKYALPERYRVHGLAYSEQTKCYYMGCSHSDVIVKLNEDFSFSDEIRLSDKFEKTGEAAHHFNDTLIIGNSLYQSMFSVTGNWKKEVFDGGIVEFDIDTEQPVGVLHNNLWMPHSIGLFDGSLTILDSLRGNLLTNNFQTQGSFPGFTRGLDYDGRYFYIGQSKNRNYSKTIGVSNNISIDTSVIIFNPVNKISKSISLPHFVPGIHVVALTYN
jgi:hypothetical protein